MSENGNHNHQNKNRKKNTKDNIKVVVRCRPLLNNEKTLCEIVCNGRKNQIGVVLPRSRGRNSNKLYTLDKIYETNTKQHDIFTESIKPIISDVLCGYNCTVFAYGQTGSGKTYTMEGIRVENSKSNCNGYTLNNEHDGIIPRAIKSIFYEIEQEHIESTVIVSHLEIYNEELRDLLSDDDDIIKKKLTIYNDTKKKCHGVFVQGLEEIIVSSPQQIFNILSKSSDKRQTAATNLNQRSSRSHCIFTVTIRVKKVIGTEEIVKTGTLNLVDLAGSESIARSGAEHNRAKEAGHINTSLLTLGRVISALVERRQHIPYRESKLTRLLQESLGGRNKTLLIATISSASPLEQTVSTLDYALRAKHIENKPTLNVSMTKEKYVKELQVLILNYRKQIEALRNEKGIYLPPKQYESMKDTIETQRTEIDHTTALFEAEKEKLMQINELFYKTNDELNATMTQRDELLHQLNDTQSRLNDAQSRLKQYAFVVRKYQINEKELRSQAVHVRHTLQNTIKDRDMLYEKTDAMHDIQHQNVSSWDEKKLQMMERMVAIQNDVMKYKTDLNEQMTKHKECINSAEHDIESVLKMIQKVQDENGNTHQLCLQSEALHTDYVETQLNKQLTQCREQTETDYNALQSRCVGIATAIVPRMMQEMHSTVVNVHADIQQLNENVRNIHLKQEQQNKAFVDELDGCIASIIQDIKANHEEETEAFNQWKVSQQKRTNECKLYVMNEMKRLLNEMCVKQLDALEEEHRTFIHNKQVFHQKQVQMMHAVQSRANEYGVCINDENDSTELYKRGMKDLNANMETICDKIRGDWRNPIESELGHLSKLITTSRQNHSDFVQNTMCVNANTFITKHNECRDKLMECTAAQNNAICETQKALQSHEARIHRYGSDYLETCQEQMNAPFVDKISNDLDGVNKENEGYTMRKYQETGSTPLKHNVTFPTKFVETESFESLVKQYNDDESMDLLGDTDEKTKSESKSRSNSPYFAEDEVEINFTERELGFRMYGGDANKNCFIRHCHSDPRVCDDAQIISIDGIDVINKSVGYIRTLLATTQRPIAIRFKNNIFNIYANTKKREREEGEDQETMMIQEPKRKRHKTNDYYDNQTHVE